MSEIKDLKFRRDFLRDSAQRCRNTAADYEEQAAEFDEQADQIEIRIQTIADSKL